MKSDWPDVFKTLIIAVAVVIIILALNNALPWQH